MGHSHEHGHGHTHDHAGRVDDALRDSDAGIRAVKIGPPETVELIDADDANNGQTLTFSY